MTMNIQKCTTASKSNEIYTVHQTMRFKLMEQGWIYICFK